MSLKCIRCNRGYIPLVQFITEYEHEVASTTTGFYCISCLLGGRTGEK